jgi:chemotaxis protein CheX
MSSIMSEAKNSLSLPEVLDTSAAPALADSLRSVRGAPIELDGGEVRRLGGLCAQVLLSAAKSWEADGVKLTVKNPSSEMTEALRLMGLQPGDLTAGEDRA